jgi:deoxyribodipyrimidine photo-lyase
MLKSSFFGVLIFKEKLKGLPYFFRECGASLLVTDFSPLHEVGRCKLEICKRVSDLVTIYEVDTHNVVPTLVASEKMEYSAKIEDLVIGLVVD